MDGWQAVATDLESLTGPSAAVCQRLVRHGGKPETSRGQPECTGGTNETFTTAVTLPGGLKIAPTLPEPVMIVPGYRSPTETTFKLHLGEAVVSLRYHDAYDSCVTSLRLVPDRSSRNLNAYTTRC